MSLTQEDVIQLRRVIREEVEDVVRPIVRAEVEEVIRPIVREEVNYTVEENIRPLRGDIEALSNDVKEIYNMISNLEIEMRAIRRAMARLEKANPEDKAFLKLDLERMMIHLNAKLLAAAKQAGITLPR